MLHQLHYCKALSSLWLMMRWRANVLGTACKATTPCLRPLEGYPGRCTQLANTDKRCQSRHCSWMQSSVVSSSLALSSLSRQRRIKSWRRAVVPTGAITCMGRRRPSWQHRLLRWTVLQREMRHKWRSGKRGLSLLCVSAAKTPCSSCVLTHRDCDKCPLAQHSVLCGAFVCASRLADVEGPAIAVTKFALGARVRMPCTRLVNGHASVRSVTFSCVDGARAMVTMSCAGPPGTDGYCSGQCCSMANGTCVDDYDAGGVSCCAPSHRHLPG